MSLQDNCLLKSSITPIQYRSHLNIIYHWYENIPNPIDYKKLARIKLLGKLVSRYLVKRNRFLSLDAYDRALSSYRYLFFNLAHSNHDKSLLI